MKLQKFIRDVTGISRRKAEELISSGEVVVNNIVATIGKVVDPEKDTVVLNGKKLDYAGIQKIYVLFNKPANCLTSRGDPFGRNTIYKYLPKKYESLIPVGRLDYDTSGLLLLTNDGELTYRMTHPKFEIEKEYHVVLDTPLLSNEKNQIEAGLHTTLISTSPAKIEIINKTELNITIHEGQNHEIKRIFESFGHKVLKLQRIRIDYLKLGYLKEGGYRELPFVGLSK